MRELLLYTGFVVITCIVALGVDVSSSGMFAYTKVMKDLFVNQPKFTEFTRTDEFWTYMEGQLQSVLYAKGDRYEKDRYILKENKLIGAPRLRQLRVAEGSCNVAEELRTQTPECYVPCSQSNANKSSMFTGSKETVWCTVAKELQTQCYLPCSKSDEDKSSKFTGSNGTVWCKVAEDPRTQTPECYVPYSKSDEDKSSKFTGSNGTEWFYQTSDQIKGTDISGTYADYGGGGYLHTLGMYGEEAAHALKLLKKNLWIDRGTRAVFIDFTVYNANVNLFCVVTLLFEFPAAGGMVPNSYFKTLKLLRYHDALDTFVLACEVFLFFYILYYSVEEVIEMRMLGFSYLRDVWNVFDLLIVIMGYVTLAFIAYAASEVEVVLKILMNNEDQSEANFGHLSMWKDNFTQFDSVFVFLVMIKLFKYLSFNKAMTQLQVTLSRCAKDIAGFCVMFFIVFLAYAQWGYLMFGGLLQEFSTFQYCIYTLFRIILGDFNFPNMEKARRVMGPIYFITYMFFVFFVLINMFLAIICDTYADVKEELCQEEDELELGDLFKKGCQKVKDKLAFNKEKILDIQEALFSADSDGDQTVDAEEFRTELKKRGYEDNEIEDMFSKYDSDGDRVLNRDEVKKMHDYLETRKAELSQEMDRVNKFEDDYHKFDDTEDGDSDDGSLDGDDEFTVLTRRVDRLEHSIGNILSKIGSVLSKLEGMETIRNKRRETMTRLLDSVAQQIDGQNVILTTNMDDVVCTELKRWSKQ